MFRSGDGDPRRCWMMEKLNEGGRGHGDNVRESGSILDWILPKSPPTGDQVFNLQLIEDISFKQPHLHCTKIKELLKKRSREIKTPTYSHYPLIVDGRVCLHQYADSLRSGALCSSATWSACCSNHEWVWCFCRVVSLKLLVWTSRL